ncbi:DUF1828 domain-containing protein, partial [Piscibacillus halophilus]|uniref:DUF1828 domain-containing protein n=1 Tax=Piscibacillus halophilus TaxID=571933 RepID=UPI001588EA69
FVDMNHDYISLFISKAGNKYILTDDGYIVNELSMLDVDINTSKKRKFYFNSILNTFGINYNNKSEELFVEFNSIKEYPEKQHRLIQCLLKISDMIFTSKSKVQNFFTEDIENFFLEKDIPYNTDASYVGKSGRSNNFDFILPKTKKINPKLIKAVNHPDSNAYKIPLLSFLDVQEIKYDHQFIVLANDLEEKISDEFKEALNNYQVDVYPWSDRENWVKQLVSF